MKFRKSGVKKQHGMIPDLQKLLEKIAQWDEVQGIVPGRIEKARYRGKLKIRVSYSTDSGLKAIARRSGSVQEIFFISPCPADLKQRLSDEGIV